MYLIIDSGITDGAGHFIMQVLQFKLCHRIIGLDSHGGVSIHPDEITQSRFISTRCTSGHNRTGRVISQCIINDTLIYFLIVFIRNLNIQINGKMVIKEFG